ncbi:MAG: DNA primase, partial [Clostridia bacterium]
MAFSDSFLDELRARCDIVDVISRYTSLTRRGGNHVGLCPFHNEKTPSFSVSAERQFFHCFGCGVGGDVITFMMRIENLDFPDAVEKLADMAGLAMPDIDEGAAQARVKRERLVSLHRAAAMFFHEQLMAVSGRDALGYLTGRGIDAPMITRFGLGFAPPGWDGLLNAMTAKGFTKSELLDAGLAASGKNGGIYDRFRNRVIFPIIDVRGNAIGFGGRVMDGGEPKYLNSPETALFNKRKNLFALNLAKRSAGDTMILAEGYMDVIALHRAGFDYSVASLGTALTDEQVKLISKYKSRVVIAYDSDEAGIKAADRAIQLFRPAGIEVRVLRMNGAKDPDEFIKKFGKERFSQIIDRAETDTEYKLTTVLSHHDIATDEGRVAYLKEAVAQIREIRSPIEREIYIARTAKIASVSPEAIKLEVDRARRAFIKKRERDDNRHDLTPVANAQPRARGLRFDNPKSARAEEGLVAALVARTDWIDAARERVVPDDFSAPMLAAVYTAILAIYDSGREVTAPAVLSAVSPDETAHITGVLALAEPPTADAVDDDYLDDEDAD